MKRSSNRRLARCIAIAAFVVVYASTAGAQNNNGNPASAPSPPPCSLDNFHVGGVSESVGLGGTMSVHLFDQQKVEDLVKCGGPLSNIVLYLDGHPMKGIPARYGPAENEIIFHLMRTDNAETQKAWNMLLGGLAEDHPVSVSVGYGDRPLKRKDDVKTILKPMRHLTAWLFLIGLAFVVGLLIHLARRSNLIRDLGPDPVDQNGNRLYKDSRGNPVIREIDGNGNFIYKAEGGRIILPRNVRPVLKAYSLARAQLAFWLFITLVSFFFIWLVTTDRQSLPTFALGILGISSATAVGSTLIDASRHAGSESDRDALESHLKDLRTQQASLQATSATNPADEAKLADVNRRVAEAQAAIKKHDDIRPTPSRGFWKDILSDDTGVTIHRFQIVAWTVALGIIFVVTVINSLTMPNYDGTLLALMGISSGAYLGLKPTEKQPG